MKRKIAIPELDGLLCSHFGHCKQFAMYEIEDNMVTLHEMVPPPPHQPGVLPVWLQEQGVTDVLAGGIGPSAVSLLQDREISVTIGIQQKPVRDILDDFIKGKLTIGDNSCTH